MQLARRGSKVLVLSLASALGAWASLALAPARAQVRPVYDRGVAGLVQALQRIRTTASAMHTGAHPDDEDTSLIARLARGDHARTAYLSLNRGEGGQNIIGLELFDALGVLRTEELLQARTLDSGDQFFTQAFDFGFTKTVEEAGAKWGERRILGDMVRAIRLYRPLVLLSRFTGTSSDGHGQHQLAGTLTPLAFKAAGDPAQFPEQLAEGLRPWQPRKLYVGQGFRSTPGNEPTLQLPTGVLDHVVGRSYAEIAMEGRSQHKSQEMGTIERRGPQSSGLRLVASVADRRGAPERSVFDGIDIRTTALATLAGLPAGAVDAQLATIDHEAGDALAYLQVRTPARIIPQLSRGLAAARAARRMVASLAAPESARRDADFLLGVKEGQLEDALVRAAGIAVDVLADRESGAPGETARATVNLFVPDDVPVGVPRIALRAPAGWDVQPADGEPPPVDAPMPRFRETPTASRAFQVTIRRDAPFTQPYWLLRPRAAEVFDWTGAPARSIPFEPPAVVADIALTIGGATVALTRGLEYRYADSVRGEIRRGFDVVPAMTVAFDEPLHVITTAALGATHRVVIRVQSQTLATASGTVRITAPPGWTVEPAHGAFTLNAPGEREAVAFSVTAPRHTPSGAYALAAEASVNGHTYDTAMRLIDYPHVRRHRMYQPAATTVRVLDLQVVPATVGYVMGSGDQVPEAIRRMGLDVRLIDEETLAAGDLSPFDVIVVGVRASESRPGFVTSHARLLQYARNGGTLIVQYQQQDYTARRLPPFPAEGATRVTDERAVVTILQRQHPAFTFPNRITDDDWAGWVQERNLYAFATFDPQYVPLLESHDPGEPPQRGGELYARLGKGHYVYTSYAWFRQLPAGVPGAYRMFANLLALAKARN